VFLENYRNQGSVKRQVRWFDNFIISTQPIGPIVAAEPPTLTRTSLEESLSWEAEVAADAEGKDIVWQSKPAAGTVASLPIDEAHGGFTGGRTGTGSLAAGATHWLRVRGVGQSDWSPWHAPFCVAIETN